MEIKFEKELRFAKKINSWRNCTLRHLVSLVLLSGLLMVSTQVSADALTLLITKISISHNNTPLTTIISDIEQKTGYSILVRLNDIDVNERYTIDKTDTSLNEVLTTLFGDKQIRFDVTDSTISIYRASVQQPQFSPQSQQGITVNGQVTDQNGGTVAGAMVVIRNLPGGVVTDGNGRYSINVPDGNATLVFSLIGYTTLERQVGAQRTINVQLVEDLRVLEDVVVVGYGQQKKVNLTGSVASVNFTESLESRPALNLSSTIAGVVPGLVIQQASAAPGAESTTLRVRGVGTLNNSDPLILIDGITGSMNDVNPYDVESVSVLKDAASSAIYGSRAANGVVLITTKRGSGHSTSVTYNGYVGTQSAAKIIDYITDYPTLLELKNEALTNSGQPALYNQADIDEWREKSKTDPANYPNTDWYREILRPSVVTEHNLSARGGNERTNFMLSLGYLDNKGVVENAEFKKYSFRLNIDSKITDWLAIGANVNGFWSDRGPVNANNLLSETIRQTNPGIIPKSEDGRYGGSMLPRENERANNPRSAMERAYGNNERQRVGTKFFARVSFLKYFEFESSFAGDVDNSRSWGYSEPTPIWNFRTNDILWGDTGRNSISNTSQRYYAIVLNEVLRFNYTLNDKHNFSALVGFDQEYSRTDRFNASKYDLLNDAVLILDAAAADPTASGTANDRALRSYYGRVNYNYDERYLFEINGRYDGSSKFVRDRRWGFFPSFSAGWRISEESFFEPMENTVSNLKLRASWGQLGNNNIGDYEYQPLYASQNYSFNNNIVLGSGPTAISNSIISWESTTITDVGLDFGLWNNKLSVTFDWFNKLTDNILVQLPVSGVLGNLSAPRQNAAAVQNRGWELQLDYNDRIGKDLNYSIGFNVSSVKNKVKKYMGEVKTINGANQQVLTEGESIWSWYMREVDHIVQDQSEIDALVADGWTFSPGTPQAGDLLYKDLNGDKKIDDNDRTIVGSSMPKFTYGMTLSLDWKGVDLFVLGQGLSGLSSYWENHMNTSNISTDSQVRSNALERWTPQNKTTKFPRLTVADNRNTTVNNFWMYDMSYFKIRSLQLGYTLPQNISEKFFVSRLRIYTSLENYFTFTKYDGFDPENAGLTYPSMKQWVMGINLTF